MTRKRLGAIDRTSVTEMRGAAEKAARERRGVAAGKAPPIAQVAGTAARTIEDEMLRLRKENESLQGTSEKWQQAEQDGLLVHILSLDDIDVHSLSRDRRTLDRDGEAWHELKASLQARGQQVPIEVGARNSLNGKRRLISGYRRWSALKELYDETGDESFSRVKALVSRARDTVGDMVAMIEENEIRQAISFYERGRICCVAAEQGICESVDDAILTLFGNSSRNRRYKIRNFTVIHARLGSYLDFPEYIGERLGAKLAQALKDGREDELVTALSDRETKFSAPAEELDLLEAFVGRKGVFSKAKKSAPAPEISASVSKGSVVYAATVEKNGRVSIKVDGLKVADAEELNAFLIKIAEDTL
ncbi:ParB N-terminal domain-containing protein [Qingshengfaniella alkalisoli]|uniref:Chromosome partitioning protein ParB n=1 Tax=Qingshengfaniella alkalisoli TaxID=2599296 RepID=A0A5B8I8K3_9RHOB|nr:ParB N-terminal domain-containing protein [Qingshengfaniella alkalisoli]QDY70345.1 chromosome partitioning protein ParB [Qingshengfaniella alkalisoli]